MSNIDKYIQNWRKLILLSEGMELDEHYASPNLILKESYWSDWDDVTASHDDKQTDYGDVDDLTYSTTGSKYTTILYSGIRQEEEARVGKDHFIDAFNTAFEWIENDNRRSSAIIDANGKVLVSKENMKHRVDGYEKSKKILKDVYNSSDLFLHLPNKEKDVKMTLSLWGRPDPNQSTERAIGKIDVNGVNEIKRLVKQFPTFNELATYIKKTGAIK